VRVDGVLREALPDLEPQRVHIIESGWDSRIVDVDGEWIVRVARNDWAAQGYRIEAALLPRLAPTLPVQIPLPVRVGAGWTLTHRIPGTPIGAQAGAELAAQLAAFLKALHAFPVDEARALGVRAERRTADVEQFRTLVLPLLDREEQGAAEKLLVEHGRGGFDPKLSHADLGPEHILVDDGGLTGVIDWTDTRIGDAAIDLAWPLHGAPRSFANVIAETYGVDASLARRALVFHALSPWHEVVHGLGRDSSWIENGLAGVRARLREVTESAGTMG
jgi:aminoglycoside phosphotransferase (APT) family kinase protein